MRFVCWQIAFSNSMRNLLTVPNSIVRLTLLILFILSSPFSWGRDAYPPSVKKLPSIELGQAILLLTPTKKSKDFVDWNHLSEGPVIWLDDGYTHPESGPEKGTWIRRGLMRINVLGKTATVLKKRNLELAWQVTYHNWGNPSLGVSSMTLEPGTPEETCFFSNTSGCTFDPLPSLKSSGFKVKEMCKAMSGNLVTGYELTHPKRNMTYIRVAYNYGSGGENSSITLWPHNGKEAACETE